MEKVIEGEWPADDLRRAFVAGAAWWEYQTSRATMWITDRIEAEEEAEGRYPDGKVLAGPVPLAGRNT